MGGLFGLFVVSWWQAEGERMNRMSLEERRRYNRIMQRRTLMVFGPVLAVLLVLAVCI